MVPGLEAAAHYNVAPASAGADAVQAAALPARGGRVEAVSAFGEAVGDIGTLFYALVVPQQP